MKSKLPLKWVGGKTQIIDKIFSYFPKEIHNYYDPFVGGGSVFLELLEKIDNGQIKITGKLFINDINEALIYFYKNISQHKEKTLNEIKVILEKFNGMSENDKEKFYYEIRGIFNESDKKEIMSSVRFFFLNKTCFRGLFREGPNGFNVPYGHYKKIDIPKNIENIDHMANLINKYSVVFSSLSFETFFKENLEKNELNFIYIDPPYVGETSKSFTGYHKIKFSNDDLFNLCKELSTERYIMHNSNTAETNSYIEKYLKSSDNNIVIEKIFCKRAIHRNNPGSMTYEIMVINNVL